MNLEPWGPVHRTEMARKYRASLMDLVVMHGECCNKPLPDTTIRTIAFADYRSSAELGERAKNLVKAMRAEKMECECGKQVSASAASYHAYHSGRAADLVMRFDFGLFGISGPKMLWWTEETGYRPATLDLEDERVFTRDAVVRSIAVVRETQGIEAAFPVIEAALDAIPGDPALLAHVPRLVTVGKTSIAGAIVDLHRQHHPEDPEGHYWDAEIIVQLINRGVWGKEHLADAEASLKRTLALAPDHLSAHMTLAATVRLRGDEAAAIGIYERAIKAHPESDLPHYNLAAMVLEKNPALALAHFQAGERVAAGDADYPIGCARALVRLGRRAEAEQALARGVALAPEHPRIAEVRAALQA
jgi:tetratricopeptide (TPR) repeat protein